MTKLHLIILLTWVNGRTAFVIYDIDTIFPRQYGVTFVDLYLKSLDPFYINWGTWSSCDDFWEYRFIRRENCDLEVYSRPCIMKQEFIGKRGLHDYEGFHKRSFTIDSMRQTTYETGRTNELNCGSVAKSYFEQVNNVYLIEANYKRLSRVEAPYSNIIQSTSFAGDDTFRGNGYTEPFGIYNVLVKASYTVIQSFVVLRNKNYLKVFDSIMLEEYVIYAKCATNYFGKTCWYKCQDNVKITCNCKYSEFYSNVPCYPVCKPGWIPSYITSKVGGVDETLINCYILDICNSPFKPPSSKCDSDELCLPVNNSTNLCEYIYAHISPFNSTENLTSDVFYYDEMIHITLEKFYLKEPLVGVNTTTAVIATEEVFAKYILDLKHDFPMTTFIVGDSLDTEETFNFTIVMELKAWNRFINRFKRFRINYPPTDISLLHLDMYVAVETYIYIGEYITFNSTADPIYRVVNFWRVETINFTLDFGNEIQVATDYFGLAKIVCRSILIVKGRKNPTFEKNFTVIIKPFVYFGWNVSNNVLEYNTKIKCHAKAYIVFYLLVMQISGISVLSEQPDLIWLKDVAGGKYELLCFFMTEIHITFSKLISFKLRVFPTEVCLFLYANVMGSIVQCGHNGFIYDEYSVKVYFLTLSYGNLEIKAEGLKYLRIPYQLDSLDYKILCNITNVFNPKQQISYSTGNELSKKVVQSYTVSNLNKVCLKYDEYVEIPKFNEFSTYKVILDHYVFYFANIFQSGSGGWGIAILAVLSPLFGFVSVFIILRRVSDKGIKMSKNNNALIKKSRLRTLNDRVRIEAAKQLIVGNSVIGNFFKGQSFNWTHSSSYHKASVIKRK